ncbi:N-acetyltransferase GCN5 [Streptomyces albospinus]|uniref:N-acetyltransferase GCN5 n=1 Tax=Streptomyces albospinus TaxID=285515 RepID=A0ABQ2V0P3_9ACTN|nr:GNAT family N-acetyltransferase [Streptomyces albospinus]GGU61494.1 N-acetyltransferase GCN5 [Streptomyces albospinus]
MRPLSDTSQLPPRTPDELTVTAAPLDLWHDVVQWTADEGWNPGRGDIACFHPTDPDGFFIGRRGDRTLSAVSVVNYSDRYAFLGYYLVAPGHRGEGHGLATWRAAVPHAAARTVGLDAVPAQQATYRRAGFTPAYDTLRYTGRPTPAGATPPEVVPVSAAHLDAVAAYDRRCFPADRRGFVARWLTADGHTARVFLRDGAVAGYGVIRPARSGHRIGPLFADTPRAAEALFDALTAPLDPADEVTMDIPEPRGAAHALATARGLTPRSHTVRMYTGPVPAVDEERTFGVTSLELG